MNKEDKYIDFKINGKLFPSWVLANYKDYMLSEIIRNPTEDACNKKSDTDKISFSLHKYQQFAGKYLDFEGPYREILMYHGLGSGKTASAINIYNMLYKYTPGWNVFFLIPSSLRGTWNEELEKWLNKDEYEYRYKNIIFIHYNSPRADRNFLDAIKNTDHSKKNIYFIDEVHNFISNVYSNISNTEGTRAQTIYNHIIRDKLENPDTRIVALSATPAINKPFELALLFNMLRPGIFPKSETAFNNLFLSTSGSYQSLNKNFKNLFQRRILGLVSYYYGGIPDFYAKKKIHYVDVPMSKHQEEIYDIVDNNEKKQEARARMAGHTGSVTYKSATRQACNFVFPHISQRVNGELRPKTGSFRISSADALKIQEGTSNKEQTTNKSEYKKALNVFIGSLKQFYDEKNNNDIKNGHTIINDIKVFKEKYKGDYSKFDKEEKKKSSLYNAMVDSSRKFVNSLFLVMNSPGPVIIYSNYVFMEGIEIYKIYAHYFGFYNYHQEQKRIKGKFGYVEFHSQIDKDERYNGMNAINESDNKFGEHIKMILISKAGSEGLSLKNIRQVHILEPYWNEVRISQMIGRGIRHCSHKDLPLDQRVVNVYRFRSVRTINPDNQTTDIYIETMARSKDGLIQSFLNALKEAAIDCSLNKNHNMLTQQYKCFQFDENSLFNEYIGPAYKNDINEDIKYNNGLNNLGSLLLKIKVYEIEAVILLEKDGKLSNKKKYWYSPKTLVVYDYDLHYPIGKIAADDDNNPVKIDKTTYLIDQLVPIPIIES